MNDERVSFPRWWITRARDQLMAMDMPSGPLGDWVFLFREQLNDALNRPDDTTVAATPASKDVRKILNDHFYTGEPGQPEAIEAALIALRSPPSGSLEQKS